MSEIAGSDQVQDTNLSGAVSPAPVSATTPPVQSEKLLTQQEVNEVVGRAKREAVERYQRQQQQQPLADRAQPSSTSSYTPDDVRRIAAEESQRLMEQSQQDAYRKAQEDNAQRIASEFFGKLATGKGKYQDFDKVLGEVDLRAIPHVVQLATGVDNTVDVMYELAKNPTKIAAIQQLISIQPNLAMAEIQRLSRSIKENEETAATKLPRAPLSQIVPSSSGMDNGVPSVKDLRRKYKA